MNFLLIFALGSASLIILEEFGIVFDMVFDEFDESLFEQGVVVLNPGGERVLLLENSCWLLVTCFLEEEGDQVKYFF